MVVAPDPERIKARSRIAANIFPRAGKIVYRVTTDGEFRKCVDQFFGALSDMGSVGDLLSDMDEGESGDVGSGDDVPPPPTTSWYAWSTRSLSKPTSRARPTSISSRGPARTRCRSVSARTVRCRIHRGPRVVPECAGDAPEDHV